MSDVAMSIFIIKCKHTSFKYVFATKYLNFLCINNIIKFEIDKHIPIEQTGVGQERNCCDQVPNIIQ